MSRLKISTLAGVALLTLTLALPTKAHASGEPTELDRLAVLLAAIHEDPAPEQLEAFRPGLYRKLAAIEADPARLRLARLRALGAMAREDKARTMPRVLALLDDSSALFRLRLGAAWNLGHALTDQPEAVPALERLLQDPDPGLRERAVISLSKIGTPRALAVIDMHRFVERDVVVRTLLRELSAAQRGVPLSTLPREGHARRPMLRPQTRVLVEKAVRP